MHHMMETWPVLWQLLVEIRNPAYVLLYPFHTTGSITRRNLRLGKRLGPWITIVRLYATLRVSD